MYLSNPLEHLSHSLAHAAYYALTERKYEDRDWEKYSKLSPEQRADEKNIPMIQVVRRPEMKECRVVAMFPQMWGSTALGFGGLGGAAMTEAYTVIIEGPNGDWAVYWSGKFAYHLELNAEEKALFMQHVLKCGSPSRKEIKNFFNKD